MGDQINSDNLKYGDLTRNIIGCAMRVHSQIGCGFQELIYQRALSVELKLNDILHEREKEIMIRYKGFKIGTRRVDFLVSEIISVEIKAISSLDNSHIAQALNYLEAFNIEIGLLINFGETKLNFKRLNNKKYNPKLKMVQEILESPSFIIDPERDPKI